METPKLIIFDCDGVLVDSERITCEVIAKNLSSFGLKMTTQEAMDLFVGTSAADDADVVRSMGANIPDNWSVELHKEIHTKLKQGVPAIAGIPQLLETLQTKNIPFCVASNGKLSKMKITLGGTGLLESFKDAMFSAYTINSWKPDPKLFLYAAATMGFTARECVVIEDSVSGAKAAHAANMKCLAYCADADVDKLSKEKAIPFYDMAELPKLLNL